MSNESNTLEKRVYTIAHDLSYTIEATLEDAYKRRPSPLLIVSKWNTGQTESYFNNFLFIHSGYKLIRPGTSDNYYEEQGWKLLQVHEPHDRRRTSCLTIADPTGNENILINTQFNDDQWSILYQIDGICNAMRLIRFLASYQSWAHFEEVKGPWLEALRKVDLSQSYYDPEILKGNRRVYLWKLGGFLADTHSKMSLPELKHHLVRNHLNVSHSANEFIENEMEAIIRDVEDWLSNKMGLHSEAMRIARVFVL